MNPTKGYPSYMSYLPPWILEYPKGGVVNKNNYGKEYCWCKEHRPVNVQWVLHKPEYCVKRSITSSDDVVISKSSIKVYNTKSNKNLTLTKYLEYGLLAIKETFISKIPFPI